MKWQTCWRMGLVTLAALLSGCASLQQLVQAPSVSVAGVRMQDISFAAVTLDFDLQVHNPNAFGASLQGFDYRFVLQNNELFSGSSGNALSVPAQGNGHLHIPVKLNFKEIYALISETKSLDSLAYQVSGNVKPGGLLAGFALPFSKSGRLPNIRIPEVALGAIKVNKLNLSGADLNFSLKVKNPNAFAFDIGKLNYAISLAGQSVASGISDKLASVPQKGSGEITLPIRISFAGAASSLVKALSGGSIDAAVAGSADLATPFGQLALPLDAQQKIAIF